MNKQVWKFQLKAIGFLVAAVLTGFICDATKSVSLFIVAMILSLLGAIYGIRSLLAHKP